MDALASDLIRTAGDIASAADGFTARAQSIDFLGPAATRFRASVTVQRRRSQNAAARAMELGHLLRRAAEDARSQLAAWERYVALLEARDR